MRHQTALGRVKGLGSARSGSRQWVAQKVSAVVLAVLFLWFAFSFATNLTASHKDVVAWLAKPTTTVLVITFIVTAFYHAILGLQVFLEDYIGKACVRLMVVNAMRVIMMIIGLSAVYAVVRISSVASVLG